MCLSAADIRDCLSFYSRLPTPPAASAPDFSRLAPALPVAGAILGAFGAAALLLAGQVGFAPLVAAACAIATLAIVTGAMHEDGLADVADGFGGGASREAKLAIMRDSRVGAYGVLALCLATILRVAALAALFERSVLLAACVLLFVGALSRLLGLTPMLLAPPARADGLGASAPALTPVGARTALAVAATFAVPAWLAGASLAQLLFAFGVAGGAVFLFARLAQRQIGGYTGDVLGGAQQIAEIAMLICLSAR